MIAQSKDAEAYGRLIAARTTDALIISKENHGFPVPWTAAVASGRAWAVYIADRGYFPTLAFDFDDKGGDPEREAEDCRDILLSCGFPVALSASGSATGRHILSRLSKPANWGTVSRVVSALRERWPSLDPSSMGSGTHAAIRPPYSPHRSGTGYSLPIGEESEANLARTAPPSALLQLMAVLGIDPRGAYIQHLLRYGDSERRYVTRSEALRAVALSYVNAGISCETFVEDVLKSPLKEKARERAHAAQWLVGEFERASSYARRFPAIRSVSAFKSTIAGIRHEAHESTWKGRSAPTDRAVLEAALAIAEHAGKIRLALSAREIADRAAVSRSTASVSLHRLERQGWLRLVSRAAVGSADAYGWELRSRRKLDILSARPPEQCDTSVRDALGHDTWRWHRGLGRASWLVWAHLSAEPIPSAVLIARLGRSPSALRRQLRRLAVHGLAVATERGWVRGRGELDEVSRVLGADGCGALQARIHALEREAHAAWQIRRKHPVRDKPRSRS